MVHDTVGSYMSLRGRLRECLLLTVAVLLSIGGISLLFIGAYFTGFGWQGLSSIVVGIGLLTVGLLILLRQDSEVSARLVGFIKEVFMST